MERAWARSAGNSSEAFTSLPPTATYDFADDKSAGRPSDLCKSLRGADLPHVENSNERRIQKRIPASSQ